MRVTRRLAGWGVGLALVAAMGCGEDSHAPGGTPGGTPGPEGPQPPASGVLASAPVARSLLGQSSDDTVAYVAAPTGLLARGASAAVVHPRTGERVLAMVESGGFDPVALAAVEGDSLEVTVMDGAGRETLVTTLAIKRGTKPRVVRTAPAPQATDVPLNSVLRVVFTTPVTRAAAAEAVRLLRGGEVVAGTVRLNGEADVVVEFAPTTRLSASTAYELRVDGSLRDVLGGTLETPVAVPFTTGVTVEAPTAGLELVYTDGSRWYLPKTVVVYTRPGELYAIRADGSGRTQLTPELALEPDVAADGRIAYLAGAFELRVREPGGAIRTLSLPTPAAPEYVPRCPVWSPDMRYIAYLESDSNNPEVGRLHVVYADSSTVEVRPMPAGVGCPAWSPDGSRLSVQSVTGDWQDPLSWGSSELRVISLATGAVSTVPSGPMQPGGWSPSGDALVAITTRPNFERWVDRVSLTDGRREPLFRWDNEWHAPVSRMDEPYLTRPRWSHDGTMVTFSDAEGLVWVLRAAASWGATALPMAGQDPTFVPPGVSLVSR
jgi:hypothetical protein